jgi:c-di-GMP-binding flagellar brake protein YcgR
MEIGRWIKQDCIVNVSPSLEGDAWYASKVLEIGSKSFNIASPKITNIAVSMHAGRDIRVGVPSRDGLFIMKCEVLSEAREPVASLEIGFPKEVVHVERRAFPRLPVRLETQYAEIRGGSGGLSFSRSTALDISGGGIRLETNRVCLQETLLRVKFQLPLGEMTEELILTGRIVRSVPGEGARKSQAGVEFIDISPRQQETLVQYVLDRMKDNSTYAH